LNPPQGAAAYPFLNKEDFIPLIHFGRQEKREGEENKEGAIVFCSVACPTGKKRKGKKKVMGGSARGFVTICCLTSYPAMEKGKGRWVDLARVRYIGCDAGGRRAGNILFFAELRAFARQKRGGKEGDFCCTARFGG